jgi:hypothetical protein
VAPIKRAAIGFVPRQISPRLECSLNLLQEGRPLLSGGMIRRGSRSERRGRALNARAASPRVWVGRNGIESVIGRSLAPPIQRQCNSRHRRNVDLWLRQFEPDVAATAGHRADAWRRSGCVDRGSWGRVRRTAWGRSLCRLREGRPGPEDSRDAKQRTLQDSSRSYSQWPTPPVVGNSPAFRAKLAFLKSVELYTS